RIQDRRSRRRVRGVSGYAHPGASRCGDPYRYRYCPTSPAGTIDYVAPGKPLTFYTVVEAARRRGQCAIGYMLTGSTGGQHPGVVVNPAKSSTITFSPADRVVVLAED
ncbi:MAG: hypothetical protein ABJA50_12290, partial [Chloroflexota bacterium]